MMTILLISSILNAIPFSIKALEIQIANEISY